MTLKTLTGPSIQDALADARRLFGDVVLLQSSPGGPDAPASVTVAFDDAPRPAPRAPSPARPSPAASAVPEPGGPVAPRAYGYGAARQVRPAVEEPFSTPATAAPAPLAAPTAGPAPAPPTPTASAPAALGPAGAPADEVETLRARLAELEATLDRVRSLTPAPRRAPLVLVGRAGSGKTTLALRLAQSPALTGAASPAVLVVAPEAGPFLDPAPSFWDAGVPVAVVRSADDVAEALRAFAEADLLLVDTPALPLHPDRARPAVARLGAVLAPLAAVEVALAVDASRALDTLTAESLDALGLRPDALALTRLDEATCAPDTWERHLGLPTRFCSVGPDRPDLTASSDAAAPLAAFASAAAPAPPAAPATAAGPPVVTDPAAAPPASAPPAVPPVPAVLSVPVAPPRPAASAAPETGRPPGHRFAALADLLPPEPVRSEAAAPPFVFA